MEEKKQKHKSLVKTFDNDIYIIEKTPDEIMETIAKLDMVRMPNGSYIHKKSISAIQSYEDYTFQVDQKERHKKNQYLRGGMWWDRQGEVTNAHLEKITGDIKKIVGKMDATKLPEKTKTE